MAIVVAEGVVEVTADGTAVPRDVARDINAGASSAAVACATDSTMTISAPMMSFSRSLPYPVSASPAMCS